MQLDLACILDHALSERDRTGQGLPALLGLPASELKALASAWFPGVWLPDLAGRPGEGSAAEQDIATLLVWRAGTATPETRWLAAIIARRSQEPRHLWEDLGLPNRAALNTLMERHFPQLSAARPEGMRWKKFLYRQICSDPGHTICPAPTCDACAERADCFVPA